MTKNKYTHFGMIVKHLPGRPEIRGFIFAQLRAGFIGIHKVVPAQCTA
jgi:hypothetical protein